jgi:D-aminopeptidase
MSDCTLIAEFDERKIDAIFAELDQCCLPGAAVGIAIRGKPMYRRGFGLANMELPVILSPTIRMRIASVTKHFTCLAYLLLCEDGKAGVDDPIGTYLPETHPVTRGVTIRQLMGHLGGLRDAHDLSWQFCGTGRAVSSADLLSLYCDIDSVNAAPGTAWIYSNGGYLMLSVAIERITGQSLEDVLRERIFDPVGMYATLLRRLDTDFVPNSATLHMVNPTGGYEKSHLGVAFAGEAGMVSTVDDMLRWLAQINAPVVGSTATWEIMKEPQRLTNGTLTGYALGLVTGQYRGVETISHIGGTMGGNARMLKVPAAGLDIVVMVNRGDVWAALLSERILDACLPGLDPIKEPSRGPFASGVFRSPTTGRVVHLFAKEGRQIASIDGTDMLVEPDDGGVLWPVGISRHVKQAVTLAGGGAKPVSIRLSDFGNVDELVREKPLREPDVRVIAGHYLADRAAATEATILETSDGPQLLTAGRFGSAVYPLENLADGIWRAKSISVMFLGGILLFDDDGSAFHFSTSSTRALTFRRDGTASAGGAALGMAKVFVDWPRCRSSVRAS